MLPDIPVQFSLLDPMGRIMIWPVGLIIDFLAAAIVTAKLYSVWKSTRNPLIGNLAASFGSFVFMWFFMGVPAIMRPDSPVVTEGGILLGHAFAYLGLAFFGRMIFSLIRPSFKNIYFVIIIAWGAFLTVANTVYFATPQIIEFTRGFSVTNINPQGFLFWNIMPLIVVATWGLGGIYFLIKSFQKKYEKRQRIQSLILGASFLILLVAGPFHLIVKTPLQYLIIETVFALAHFMILYGVFYRGLTGPAYNRTEA